MDISIKNMPGVCYVDGDHERRVTAHHALLDCAGYLMMFEDTDAALAGLQDGAHCAIVVCDLQAPGMDALQFLRKVDELDPTVVTIVITDLPGDHDKVAAARLSAYRWRVLTQDAFFNTANIARTIRDASAVNARRRFKRLRDKHTPEIRRRLAALGVKGYDLSIMHRLQSLIACHLGPWLDIPDLDKFLLAVAADHYDIGRVVSKDPECEREAAVQILGGLVGFEKVLEAARDYCECFDGTGPQGKRGDAIPLFARIIAVVDRFTALIVGDEEVRPVGADEALGLIQGASGELFDPEVVEVFCQMIRKVQEEKASGQRGEADTATLFLTPPAEGFGLD